MSHAVYVLIQMYMKAMRSYFVTNAILLSTRIATVSMPSQRVNGKYCWVLSFTARDYYLFCVLLRYCNVCESGGSPATTTCELCSYTGGAYKPTEKTGKWAHSLCAFWIPEIFTIKSKNALLFTLSNLDKKRFRLRCNLFNDFGFGW